MGLLNFFVVLCGHAYLYALTCALEFMKVLLLQTQLYDFCTLPLPVSLQSEEMLDNRSQGWYFIWVFQHPVKVMWPSEHQTEVCVRCLGCVTMQILICLLCKSSKGTEHHHMWDNDKQIMKQAWGWYDKVKVAEFGKVCDWCYGGWLLGRLSGAVINSVARGFSVQIGQGLSVWGVCMFCISAGWLPPTVKDM